MENTEGLQKAKNIAIEPRFVPNSFNSDWTAYWCEFHKSVTKHSTAKPKQTHIAFDFQV